MRIAHVSDCFFPRLGGIERQVHDLALRQLDDGHDVHVITTVAGEGDGRLEEKRIHRPAIRLGPPDRISYESSWSGRAAVLAGEFDLVHVHASTCSPLALLTAASTARAGVPTALTVHSLMAYAEPLYAAGAAASHLNRLPIAWSAVSSVAAAPLRRVLGRHLPVTVLPNGVEPAAWRLPRRFRDPKRVVVVSVGRLAKRKRPRHLLHMLRDARAAAPADVRLEAVIVGDGPLGPAMQRFLDRHRMADWVRLAGSADHDAIRSVYADSDIYVAPARLESFGIAALEARCAGLPVIAHAGCGIADYITHGVDGLLTADDAGMTRAIVELATNHPSAERLRQHNCDVPPAITWDTVLDACDVLYERARTLATARRGIARR